MSIIERFELQVKRQPWGDEILVAHIPGVCTGKLLRRYAGEPYHRGGLQWHVLKDETFYLHEGEVYVYFVHAPLAPGPGQLRRVRMTPGMSFHIPPGAIHSVQTITDSLMFEVSSPMFGDRVNVEAEYDIEAAIDVAADTICETFSISALQDGFTPLHTVQETPR